MYGIDRVFGVWRGTPGRVSVWLTVALCLAVVVGGTPGLVYGAGSPAERTRLPVVAQEGLSGDVIVVLDDSSVFRAAAAVVDVAVDTTGAEPVHVYDSAINGFSATLSAAEVEDLADDPNVVAIIPDITFYAAAQTLPTGVDRIDADQNPIANINGSDERVNADVAVLDAGMGDTSDLNVAGGVDCFGTNTGDYADTSVGHGTHVAGIIGALDNGSGVVGVAPGARIWAVKVLSTNSAGQLTGQLSDLMCGLDWVLDNAGTIDVANMSLTGTGSDGTCADNSLREMICAVAGAGVRLVAAAGNGGVNVGNVIPATYPEVIAVSGFNDSDGQPGNDTFYGSSNYGADIDIAAPAVNIQSITGTKTGTSMAAAHVTGAIALQAAGGGDIFALAKAQNSSAGFTGDVDGIPELVLCVGPCGGAQQNASMTLNRTRTTVNVNVTATLTGFPANSSVTVAFVGTTYPSSDTVTTNGSGAATARVKVPATPIGDYSIRASSGSTVVNRPFEVAPRIKVMPRNNDRGDTVDVSLRGYGKKETVRIRWRVDGSWRQLTTVLTSNSGSANIDVQVPNDADAGQNSVRGDGPIARQQTNAVFVDGPALQSAAEAPPGTPAASPDAGTPIAEPVAEGTPQATETIEVIVEPTEEPAATEVPTETPTETPTEVPAEVPTETPIPEPTPYAIVADVSSDPAAPGWVTYDDDPLTYWEVTAPAPLVAQSVAEGTPEVVLEPAVGPDGLPLPAASLVLDLGTWMPVGTVRWVYAVEGIADDLRIEVSDDGINWLTVTYPGQVGNALPGEWQELVLPPETFGGRYVRFAFENPNGDLTLGGIAELEIWP